MNIIVIILNVILCCHFMHSFHLVLCADVILKDEYCELIVCYVLENLNSLEDLNNSVNCGRIFHGLFQQLRGEMDIFHYLLAP